MEPFNIDKALKEILLNEVEILHSGRVLVSGKLTFYDCKDFNYKLSFECGKVFEFPYPFETTKYKKQYCFSYKNVALHKEDPVYMFKMGVPNKNTEKKSADDPKHRLYDSELIVRIKG